MRSLRVLLLVTAAVFAGCRHLNPPPASETVVLVHGMGRTTNSMTLMAARLRDDGYRVLYFGYREQDDTLTEIAGQLRTFTETHCAERSFHLVAHSLGNIVIREAFRDGWPDGPARIVMLAPPNRPARLAATFRDNPLYRWRTGDAGRKLSDPDYYATLPVPPVPFGVIAGTRGQSWTFDGPNDGIVAVDSTRIPGMADFATVHHTHTFMKHCTDTYDLVRKFLRSGRFSRRT